MAEEVGMVSIEQSVKSQFAKVFEARDWMLLKKLAESNLREAAELRTKDMAIEKSLRLLARNSRKRLLIGVGVELLLKAVCLRQGFMINKPVRGSSLKFPFTAEEAVGEQLVADQTATLNELIEHLPTIAQMQDNSLTLKGLKIAKVFRNKEGHVVTSRHAFAASNYTDIAASLSLLYRDVFGEILSVKFSVARNERAVWQVSSPNREQT